MMTDQPASGPRDRSEPATDLAGVWSAQILGATLTGSPLAQMPQRTHRTISFTADGHVLMGGSLTTLEGGQRVYRDLGQGQWTRSGAMTFTAGLSIGNYNEDGSFLFDTRVALNLTLDPAEDSLEGTYASEDVALDGSLLRTREGTLTAQRIRFAR